MTIKDYNIQDVYQKDRQSVEFGDAEYADSLVSQTEMLLNPEPASEKEEIPIATPEEERSFGEQAMGVVNWISKPLNALQAPAAFGLAPLVYDKYQYPWYDPRNIGTAVKVGAEAAAKELKSTVAPMEGRNYGYQIVDRIPGMQDLPEWTKQTAGFALEFLANPVDMVGIGLAPRKFMQTGLRLARQEKLQRGATKSQGFFQDTTDAFLDFLDVRLLEDPALSEFSSKQWTESKKALVKEYAAQADGGDKEAFKKLVELIDTPEINAVIKRNEDLATNEFMNGIDRVYGSDAGQLLQDMKDTRPTIEIRSSRNGELYSVAKAGNINLTRYIEGGANVDQLINVFAERYLPNKQVQSWSDTEKLASRTRLETIIKRNASGNLLDATQTEALNIAMEQVGGEIITLAEKLVAGTAGPVREELFDDMLAVYQQLVLRASEQSAGAGRALNILKKKKSARGLERHAAFMSTMASKGAKGVAARNKLAQLINGTKDKDDILTLLSDTTSQKSKLGRYDDAIYEYYINALLSGPVTHFRNMLSNSLTLMMQPVTRFMSGGTAIMRGDLNAAGQAFAETGGQIAGMVQGMSDLFMLMTKTDNRTKIMSNYPKQQLFQHELNTLKTNAISAQNLELSGFMGQIANYAGRVINLSSDALLKEDNVFKMIAYRSELSRRAAGMAYQVGGDARSMRNNYSTYMNKADYQYMVKPSTDTAKYLTFSRELEGLARKFSNVASAPGIRYFIPFTRTPINVISFGMEHTPLAPLTANFRSAVKAGGATRDVALAKTAFGTGLGVALTSVVGTQVTGAAYKGSVLGEALETDGIPPYSIKVGDKWYDYSTIEPLRMLLSPVEKYKRLISHLDVNDPEDQKTIKQASGAIALTFANLASNDGFMRGAGDIFAFLKAAAGSVQADKLASRDPEVAEGAQETLGRTIMRFLKRPLTAAAMPPLLDQINKAFGDKTTKEQAIADPTLTEGIAYQHITKDLTALDELMSSFVARTPGISSSAFLGVRRNAFGEPVPVPMTSGWDVLNPFYTRSGATKGLAKYLMDLGVELPHYRQEIQGIRLSSKQQSDLQLYAGEMFKEATLNMISQTEEFPSDEARREFVKWSYGQARKNATMRLLSEDSELRNKIQTAQEEKARRMQGLPVAP